MLKNSRYIPSKGNHVQKDHPGAMTGSMVHMAMYNQNIMVRIKVVWVQNSKTSLKGIKYWLWAPDLLVVYHGVRRIPTSGAIRSWHGIRAR